LPQAQAARLTLPAFILFGSWRKKDENECSFSRALNAARCERAK
jgi:hypothetical protein